jgi:hypothetical protein
VLLRVDDYPHWTVPTDRFWDFHARLAVEEVPYLLAATPFLATQPLAPESPARAHHEEEWDALRVAVGRGELDVALHGVTHRARGRGRASEFDGMGATQATAEIARAWRFLIARGCPPVAFVPPFNRLPPALWSALPLNCAILCLGPESLRDVPLLPAAANVGGRRVVLSLPPFYGRARDVLRALERGQWLEKRGAILPITLHWTWELADDFAAATALARHLRGHAHRWTELLGGCTTPAEGRRAGDARRSRHVG